MEKCKQNYVCLHMSNLQLMGVSPIPAPQADNDSQVVSLWLHGKAERTKIEYRREVRRFIAFVNKPFKELKLADVHLFADSVDDSAPATRTRILATIKSMLSYAHNIGYLPFNVGRAITLKKALHGRSQRILTEEIVTLMIGLEQHPIRKALLRFVYATGVRVSECRIRWCDLQPRTNGGQVSVVGKGTKERTILMSKVTYEALLALRTASDTADDFVFKSNRGTPLSVSQIWRIVQAAAHRAGILRASPHFLRHSHASHALDRACPLHVVQSTLGHQSLSTTSIYVHARPSDGSGLYLSV